jgi:hypothetical protein
MEPLPTGQGPLGIRGEQFGNHWLQWCTQEFGSGGGFNFVRGGSTNSVEDRGQREWGSGGGNPQTRGSAQFANE